MPLLTRPLAFTSTKDEVSGKRVRRQRPAESSGDSALPAGGSEDGSDIEAYEEYDDEDEEDEDDGRIAPSILTPAPPAMSRTPLLKASPSPSAPASRPATSNVVIRPTKMPKDNADEWIEPTPVHTPTSIVHHRQREQQRQRISFNHSSSNSDVDFEPIEPTPSVETAALPLPDDLGTDIQPNLIDWGEDGEEDDRASVKKTASPPQVMKRLPKIPATAGKVLRFRIPSETFSDVVDGNADRLELKLLPPVDSSGRTIRDFAWIGFNSHNNEIFGLPLAEDIGRYAFAVEARNSANMSVTEPCEIHVRQHPSERAFHHRFHLQLEPEFSAEEEMTLSPAFWMLKTVAALAKVAGDRSEDAIVVRNVSGTLRNGDAFTLIWSNESLPRGHCPEDEIHDLFDLMYNKETDEVTPALDAELAPQLAVTQGGVEMDGICQPKPTMPAPTSLPGKGGGKVNTPPQVRNQVDHMEAKVGLVFRHQVLDDTFHDEEDGGTRMLKLTLHSADHQPLDPKSWLQFDVYNQEFYGLPLDSDAAVDETTYQLVATDSQGATASDALVVVVQERSKRPEDSPLVEFSLKISTDYDSVSSSAQRKVRLVEVIARLFGDEDTRNVLVRSIEAGSTLITWTNATLKGDKCPPVEEIEQLRRILLDDEGKLTQRCIDQLSANDFEPVSAKLTPLGSCLGEFTPTYGPGTEADVNPPSSGVESDVAGGGSSTWSDDYLLTFIVPGIIITLMLLMAAVIACVLYRRRRTGKLGLEERRSFVSKGIPIIFAEELEERPSSSIRHPPKAPVILKDERPSQPPPDYHKVRSTSSSSPYGTGSRPAEQRDLLRGGNNPPHLHEEEDDDDEPAASLYQPPPPLSAVSRDSTSSSRYSRPKATPAYRKPPPYVPP